MKFELPLKQAKSVFIHPTHMFYGIINYVFLRWIISTIHKGQVTSG